MFSIAGDVMSFDRVGFRLALLSQFSDAEDVTLRVTPASVNVEATLVMRSASSAASAVDLIASTPAQNMQTWFASVNGGSGAIIQNTPTATITQTLSVAPSLPPPLLPLDPPAEPPSPYRQGDARLTFRGSALTIAADVTFLLVGIVVIIAAGLTFARLFRRCRRQVEVPHTIIDKAQERARMEARAEAREELQAVISSLRNSPSTSPEPSSLYFRSLAHTPASNSHTQAEEGRTLATQGMVRVERSAVETWMPAVSDGSQASPGPSMADMSSPVAHETTIPGRSPHAIAYGGAVQPFELELAEWLEQPYCSDVMEHTRSPDLPPPNSAQSVIVDKAAATRTPPADHRSQYATYFV